MKNLSTHPLYSAWIGASAGTGKTKLLTDRIINLLLYGIAPESILCLTFTKAAKGEMLSRINAALLMFSQKNDDEIREYFQTSLQRDLEDYEVSKIKKLYNSYSSSSEKIQIYTIHGFCQNLLQKFPKEAGIKPFFQVIDEVQSSIILKKIISSKETVGNISHKLNSAISNFLLEKILPEYIDFYTNNKNYHKKISYENFNTILCELFKDYLIDEPVAEEELKSFIAKSTKDILNIEHHDIVNHILEYQKRSNNRVIFEKEMLDFFLTKTGEKRKKLFNKTITNKYPFAGEIFSYIQDKIFKIYISINTRDAIEANLELYKVSSNVFIAYQEHKQNYNFLDYQDLITIARDLLCSSDLRDWIKYKLDGGIDHVLVDESQDTSEIQWSIIRALIEDFFSGDSYKDTTKRTIFVVGDVKQSIYSFQGARPDLFKDTKNLIKLKATDSGANFIEATLNKTYRLSTPIFHFVYNVFDKINFIEELERLECHNLESYSSIEIWDLEKNNNENPSYFWPTPNLFENHDNMPQRIAKKIASYIKETIDSGLYLDSKKRCVAQSDFLILVQKRSILNSFLYKEIKEVGVDISGLDRLDLNENIVIQDIISCAKFIIDPKNNLNLACLLKSVFINLTDEEIAIFKNEKYWIDGVKKSPIIYESLALIEDIYDKFHGKEFFTRLIEEFGILDLLYKTSQEEDLDAVKAFLNHLSLIYQYSPYYGINDIVNLFETSEISIKRDFSQSSSVRITTVHGAKGLEAPIVILADSNNIGIGNNSHLITANLDDLLVPLWSSKFNNKKIDDLNEKIKLANYNEYIRLLYVALTRAQDHLIIVGQENRGKSEEYRSWYEICKDSAISYFEEHDGKMVFLRGVPKYEKSQQYHESEHNIKQNVINDNLMSAAYHSLDQIPNKRFLSREFPSREAFNFENPNAILGEAFHKILEIHTRDGLSIDKILDLDIVKNLCDRHKDDIREVLTIAHSNEYFLYLKSLDHREEVEVAIRNIEGKMELKRIDFIAFKDEDKEIVILDYKSDRERVGRLKYINQLSSYKKIIQNIYPSYQIETKIFWLRDNLIENVSC